MPTFETIVTPEMVERYTRSGAWPDTTITDYLDRSAERHPDKVAFIDSRRSITYAQLKADADRCALGLLERGIKPGDVVSYQLPNWIEFVVVMCAVSRIGAVNNALIPIYRKREVQFMMELAESKLVIVPREFRGFDHAAMMQELAQEIPSLESVLVIDAAPGQESFDEFMATPWEERRDASELAALRPDPNEVTLLIFTSGTTGEPKGVMHSHNTTNAPMRTTIERMGVTDETVFHMASTFAHYTGWLFGARMPIVGGCTCVLQDIWNADEFARLVAEHGINYTSGATPFLVDLLHHLPEDLGSLSSLNRFCAMGAPIPRAIVQEARERLPSMTVLGGWGQTENALVTIGIPGDPIEKIVKTDGYPQEGMEVRTVDLDDQPVPAGTEGRVQVRGPFQSVGYAKRIEMTRRSYTRDGWFDTGDLAELDEDGYLKISGRTKDIVMRGGENIPVAYVENVLYENPAFASVAIVAQPDERLQEIACACLVMKPGKPAVTLPDIQDYLREKGVAKQYWPERVRIMPELPTTASGKIQKYHLREMVEADPT